MLQEGSQRWKQLKSLQQEIDNKQEQLQQTLHTSQQLQQSAAEHSAAAQWAASTTHQWAEWTTQQAGIAVAKAGVEVASSRGWALRAQQMLPSKA